MARRRSWLDRVNPAKWLGKIVDAIIPTPTPRRRASRTSSPGRSASPARSIPLSGERPGDDAEYREIWDDEGGQGSYRRAHDFFEGLPAAYEYDDEEEDTWRSFVRYMINDGGYRRNDPANPFWSAIGLHPTDFDWAGWRAAMGYGGRR